ncbi:MAG: GGDEF domain-containing protein [Magnetococcales bacterium]|nr:GGDEF domain-containing protein [Magnetococcales bacterium]
MSLTDYTLAEQLKITDRRVQRLKLLFNLTQEDEQCLLVVKPYIEQQMDSIIDKLYSWLLDFPEVVVVIGDAETLLRLKNTMRGYIAELFSGNYDRIYINSRLRIGIVHKRIGVSPPLYMAAVRMLSNLLESLIEDQCKDGTCSRFEAEQRKISLQKILMFDVQLVFDTYTGALVSAVDIARQELEDYAMDLEATVAQRTQELKDLARLDGLTGLVNQRAFYERLRNDLAHSKRRCEPITLIYFDLNRFKALNDNAGHKAGDLLLAHVGETLLATMREVDTVARYGGDEFCIILPNSTTQNCHDVVQRFVERFYAKTNKTGVAFSMGIVDTGPNEFISSDDLVKSADKCMYISKEASRDEPGFWMCGSDDKAKLILATPDKKVEE